jgi:hypothetical protein
VPERDVNTEARELLNVLHYIDSILSEVEDADRARQDAAANPRDAPKSSVQFYIWDTLQHEHYARVIGRHQAVPGRVALPA